MIRKRRSSAIHGGSGSGSIRAAGCFFTDGIQEFLDPCRMLRDKAQTDAWSAEREIPPHAGRLQLQGKAQTDAWSAERFLLIK